MTVRRETFAVTGPAPAVEVRNPAGSVLLTAVEGATEMSVDVEALKRPGEGPRRGHRAAPARRRPGAVAGHRPHLAPALQPAVRHHRGALACPLGATASAGAPSGAVGRRRRHGASGDVHRRVRRPRRPHRQRRRPGQGRWATRWSGRRRGRPGGRGGRLGHGDHRLRRRPARSGGGRRRGQQRLRRRRRGPGGVRRGRAADRVRRRDRRGGPGPAAVAGPADGQRPAGLPALSDDATEAGTAPPC